MSNSIGSQFPSKTQAERPATFRCCICSLIYITQWGRNSPAPVLSLRRCLLSVSHDEITHFDFCSLNNLDRVENLPSDRSENNSPRSQRALETDQNIYFCLGQAPGPPALTLLLFPFVLTLFFSSCAHWHFTTTEAKTSVVLFCDTVS